MRLLSYNIHKGIGGRDRRYRLARVIEVIEEENLLANCRARGAELKERLQQRLGQHPHVGDIRGRGLFIGIELVADYDIEHPQPSGTPIPIPKL